MKLLLITKSKNRPVDDPWSWLKGVIINSQVIEFKGNIFVWLYELYPLLADKIYEYEEDVELILEMYQRFRMTVPKVYYEDQFRSPQKENEKKDIEKKDHEKKENGEEKSIDSLYEKYIKQTPDIPLSNLNNHTDYTTHNDFNGYDDHGDHSLDIHGDYGRDYDDHMDSSKFIHGDYIGWNNRHDDGYQDYDDQSHVDETHSDSYNEYDDHQHRDYFYTDYNEHTDINK
ncbi:hypothetical protein H0486_04240 [Lachnospiraceae bacterium MD1]|jgi:hypothetical protein|uniref:Uncharacterized protein n=1 Tax=Variimorphobacter saccharofermentans TaxID=2755051 RepID=A0A839JYM0_9FIRM|nr:hypothetical protein [Variimorphobacter saccharofermentans]MBB2182082.1 hypothetical protein [Variimorphobacter saccharofermentans]